jgi:hypothetical protein
MSTLERNHRLFLLILALLGCGDAASTSDASSANADDGGAMPHTKDGGPLQADAARDADAEGCAARVACAPAPPGCSYVGGDGCSSCGALRCADAGDAQSAALRDAGREGGSADAGDAGREGGANVDAGPACGANFPSFARGCVASSDCRVVTHQRDCCGSLAALAIRSEEQARFQSAEALCVRSSPVCDCLAQPTRAEDGTSEGGGADVRAVCVDRQCTSTFSAPSTGACTPGGNSCGLGYSCCYPCGIPDCAYACEPTCAAGTPACANGCLLRP